MTALPAILTVCTGNICRSPLAQHLLQMRLEYPLSVESAGTQAVIGGRVPRQQARLALEYDAHSILGHAGRQLTPEMVAGTELILTASQRHRRAVVRMEPSAARRAFTLREFAWLSTHVEDADLLVGSDNATLTLAHAVNEVHALRGFVTPPEDLGTYDIDDPYGNGDAAYETATRQVNDAVQSISDYLNRALRVATGYARSEVTP